MMGSDCRFVSVIVVCVCPDCRLA